MKFILKLVLSAIIIYLLSKYLSFVKISDFSSLILFMLILLLFNISLKPLLILLTIPVTIVTFGLFLIVINGILILLTDYFISGIHIGNGILGAIIFSLFISLSQYFVDMIIGD